MPAVRLLFFEGSLPREPPEVCHQQVAGSDFLFRKNILASLWKVTGGTGRGLGNNCRNLGEK